jgi:hypothetical protein
VKYVPFETRLKPLQLVEVKMPTENGFWWMPATVSGHFMGSEDAGPEVSLFAKWETDLWTIFVSADRIRFPNEDNPPTPGEKED